LLVRGLLSCPVPLRLVGRPMRIPLLRIRSHCASAELLHDTVKHGFDSLIGNLFWPRVFEDLGCTKL
jgi:hypothetical protein